jgi:chromosome partitioning protein
MRFLDALDIPIAAVLRDSQNYIRAAESGIGLHEMKPPSVARVDVEQWEHLFAWIEEGRVTPADALWRNETAVATP